MHRFLWFLLSAVVWAASPPFQRQNTSFTTLFRTDFGTLEGSDLFPTALMLIKTRGDWEDWHLDLSMMMQGQSDFSDTGLFFNEFSITRYLGEGEIRVGKFVAHTGVLDYLSVSNVLNPIRPPFFDDTDPQIRRIPQWMAMVESFPTETLSLRLYAEPFDRRYQDYTDTYLSLALDRLIPRYISDYHFDDTTLDTLKEEVLLPAYQIGIAPAIKQGVNDYYDLEDLTLDKTLVGFDLTWQGFDTQAGISWFNKYSEIPLVKLNRHLLELLLEHGDPGKTIGEYLEDSNLALVQSVDGFRYNQVTLYGETSLSRYGVRAEATWRNKAPFLEDFSAMTTMGAGIDDNGKEFYNDLEGQWIHAFRNGQNFFALLWLLRKHPFFFHGTEVTLENYTMLGATEGMLEYSFLPTATVTFLGKISVSLRYLFYPEEHDLDVVTATLGVRF